MLAPLMTLALLWPPAAAAAPDVADALVRRLRATQPADLSWGESCRTPAAHSTRWPSPRAYTDLDGPTSGAGPAHRPGGAGRPG